MRKAALNGVFSLAKCDERVLFIGSDLGAGVLEEMRAAMPTRFFMEGVSEAHVIGMSAGLAMNGYLPYINTIATFLTRRCYEQLAIDICLHNLPVRLIASGGGTVYAPLGPTHMAVEDIAILRALPNMAIVAPVDADEMSRLMAASLEWPGPLYIRLAKGGDPVVSRAGAFEIGRAICMRESGDVLFVSTGIATTRALAAAELLDLQGITSGVLHMHTVKPLDSEALRYRSRHASYVVTIEEHSRIGGLGSAVVECFADEGMSVPVLRLGLPDAFYHEYGSQDHALFVAGLAPAQIAQSVTEFVGAFRPRIYPHEAYAQ